MPSNFNLFNIIDEMSPNKSEEILTFILDYGRRVRFDMKDIVIKEGDLSDHIYIILDGIIEVSKKDHLGNEVALTELGRGSIIGEMGIFLDKKRSASIRAKTDVLVAKFTNYRFLESISKLPDLMLRLLKSFSTKISETNNKFATVVDTKILLVLGYYILDLWPDKKAKNMRVMLDIFEIQKETRLDADKLYTALNTYNKQSIIKNFDTQGEQKVVFDIEYRTLMNFLKAVSSA